MSNNLKPWAPGQSGNPKGRPKGSRNVSTITSELLLDKRRLLKFAPNNKEFKGAPVEAIVTSLICKAIDVDIKAAELLFKLSAKSNTSSFSFSSSNRKYIIEEY